MCPTYMQFLLYILVINIALSYTNNLTQFNVTIKTPGNEVPVRQIPYKSIHVKYTVPNTNDQWNIIAIEPFIEKLKVVVEQITVHICQTSIDITQSNTIWYDDDTFCKGARSMLIYHWICYSAIPNLHIDNDLGFQLDKTRFVVLSVKYLTQQQSHDHQMGIILSISTSIPIFNLGTILVGNDQQGIRFSCRSMNYPRLLYGVKSLFPSTMKSSWRIYVIRNRNFGRKIVQLVTNSTIYSTDNQTDLEPVTSDVFLIPEDHLLVECTEIFEFKCQFLIYYTYKSLPIRILDENDNICQTDSHPDLFKLLPSTKSIETDLPESQIEGKTIFKLIGLFLFIIWISIIIGCVIMRHIRGLVNKRPESSSRCTSQYSKTLPSPTRANDPNQQKILAEADRIAQLDIEHMGLMS